MKHQFKSNQEFYNHIDLLGARLRAAGAGAEADRLWELIHQVAWTTSTELFGELRNACREIVTARKNELPREILDDLRACIRAIDRLR